MKALLLGFGLMTGLTSSCVTASSSSTAGCRLVVELRDGSRMIGSSEEAQFAFQSDILGEVKLPLEKIRLVESVGRTNLVKVTTSGGDSLTARFAMENIRVGTSFGEVKLPVSLIKSVRVSLCGKAGRPLNGLLGLWSGEGNAADSVSGNDGVLRNVSFSDGVIGQAFTFAPNSFPYGTYTGVQIPDRPDYALTQALTIEGWVRPRGDGYMIFFRGDHRPGLDPYCLSMQANHDLRFQICDQDGDTASVDANIPYAEWTHVAATLDGNSGWMSLYTNGVLAAQTTTSVRPFGPLLADQFPGIGIGNVNDGGNNFPFVGDLDEMSLYDRALSGEEVKAIYSANAANAGGRAELLPTRSMQPFGMPMRSRLPGYDSRQPSRPAMSN